MNTRTRTGAADPHVVDAAKQRAMAELPFRVNDAALVRRTVARACAAEGIVLAPQHWADLMRNLTAEVMLPALVAQVQDVARHSDEAFTTLLTALTQVAQEAVA